MRPDDRRLFADADVNGLNVPLDAELEPLDAELEAAGALARRGLHGRVQPTRAYEIELRKRLLAAFPSPAVAMRADAAAGVAAPDVRWPAEPRRGEDGERWAPTPLEVRRARRPRRWLPRARWLVAAVLLTLAVAAGAVAGGARLHSILPPAVTNWSTVGAERVTLP